MQSSRATRLAPTNLVSVDTAHKETSDPTAAIALQPKQAVCAPTFNRPDRVAGCSRSTGCSESSVHSHRLINDRHKGLNERLHCAASRSTQQQRPAIFNANARSRLSGKRCSALAAQRNLTHFQPFVPVASYPPWTGRWPTATSAPRASSDPIWSVEGRSAHSLFGL